MGTWRIKRHDTYPPFSVTLYDADGIAVDLTGSTVQFVMRLEDVTTLKVDGAMTGPNGGAFDATGVAEYPWVAADTDTEGTYLAEYQVTFPANAGKQTFPTKGYDRVIVGEDLDDA